jgi:peptidoglycan/xylan/chitin deacetylase (PgdA/CDA1 family)
MSSKTDEKFESLIRTAKKVKKRRSRRGTGKKPPAGYQRLIERGVMGIETLPGGGLVSAPASVKARRGARSDRLAATPARPQDRVFGSRRNSRQTAASIGSAAKIEISAATLEALKTKLRAHNSAYGAGKRTSLGALKAVYRRGAGAFSVSHRPGMTRGQWAMGRVNAFLEMLRKGKPKNSRYVNDNDLLPRNHPWRSKVKELLDSEFEAKGNVRKGRGFNSKVGVRRLRIYT